VVLLGYKLHCGAVAVAVEQMNTQALVLVVAAECIFNKFF
jgi:hypothetical protein